jgi:peptide/nickel transport system ATP-binding protein
MREQHRNHSAYDQWRPLGARLDRCARGGRAMNALLEVRDLTVSYPSRERKILAADRVSFDVNRGETVGLVGQSGCGKSTTLKALLGLVTAPGRVEGGKVRWRQHDELLSLSRASLRKVCGAQIAMIFQDPLESLDPLFSIGSQLREVLRVRGGLSRTAAHSEAVRLLERVHIPAAPTRLRDYPHQLSGGMRQRVTIALAIARSPALLLADEPTTALDLTIQDQILSLLAELQEDLGMAILLVSHDLDIVAQYADRVLAMEGGRVVDGGDLVERVRVADGGGATDGRGLTEHRRTIDGKWVVQAGA